MQDRVAVVGAPSSIGIRPDALGMAITLYDPSLDPDRSYAERLVALLETTLGRGAR